MPARFPYPVESRPLADEELLEALAADRRAALGLLYDRYAALVYGLARAILASPQEAEDLTHEIFVGLCDRWHYDAARGSLAGFLVTLTRSRALDKLRSRVRRVSLLRRWAPRKWDEPATEDPVAQASLAQVCRSFREALARLPDSQRQVLELAYYRGLTQAEIASELDMPLGTVKSWARRGLSSLRDSLQDLVG